MTPQVQTYTPTPQPLGVWGWVGYVYGVSVGVWGVFGAPDGVSDGAFGWGACLLPDELTGCEWCQNEPRGICNVDGLGESSRPVRCKDFISRLSLDELIEWARKHY